MFAPYLSKAQKKASARTENQLHPAPRAPQGISHNPGTMTHAPRYGPQDFTKIPALPQTLAASDCAASKSIVQHHRQGFSATVRREREETSSGESQQIWNMPAIERAVPASQGDSMGERERKPEADQPTPTAQPAMAAGRETASEPKQGKVLFPDLGPVLLPGQSDAVTGNLTFISSITQDQGAPDAGEFGTTRPRFDITHRAADYKDKTYTVTGEVDATVTFDVAGGSRKDIPSDSAPDITQQNYPDVVRDLTPVNAPVHTGGLNLFKNQSPRSHFWAEDLCIKHERFHAGEDVQFASNGTTAAQSWLGQQTAGSYDDIDKKLFPHVLQIVLDTVKNGMVFPAREQRAYDDGASSYLARAQAIRKKGDAKGYVPKPAAPAPNPTAPTPAPQAPTSPAPAPKQPAPHTP